MSVLFIFFFHVFDHNLLNAQCTLLFARYGVGGTCNIVGTSTVDGIASIGVYSLKLHQQLC